MVSNEGVEQVVIDGLELACKAVNCHTKLLDALENIEANLSGSDCPLERVEDSLRRAKAAIAAATE